MLRGHAAWIRKTLDEVKALPTGGRAGFFDSIFDSTFWNDLLCGGAFGRTLHPMLKTIFASLQMECRFEDVWLRNLGIDGKRRTLSSFLRDLGLGRRNDALLVKGAPFVRARRTRSAVLLASGFRQRP
jgi:hypothetical protein